MRSRSALLVAFVLAGAIAPGAANADGGASRGGVSRPAEAPRRAAAPAWLGVGMTAAHGATAGVEVQRVVRGSPAERAGVRSGDRIVAVDGAAVAAPEVVTRAVRSHAVGERVRLEIVRDGASRAILAQLAAAPSPDDVLRMDHVGAALRPWEKLTPVHGAFPAAPADLAGRVVVLEFWATWCGPCEVTSPVLERWQRELGAQGLAVLGVSAEEPELVASHGARKMTRYALASDGEGATTRAYGIGSLPTLFVVDRTGVVRDVVVGFDPRSFARVEGLLRTLLAEPAPTR